MNKKKITVITSESSEVFVIRRPLARAWCAECAAEVGMLSPEQAAAVAGVSTRTIYRWAETGRIHFTETPEGRLLVCPNSILQ